MLTMEELEKVEAYLENKPAMKLAGFIKYLRNNWTSDVPKPVPAPASMVAATKGVREIDNYIVNPNKPDTAKTSLAKRGIYVRTEGDSALGDRK